MHSLAVLEGDNHLTEQRCGFRILLRMIHMDVQVCAKSCPQEATHCDTLAAWSLRLDDGLVTDGSFLQTVQPGVHVLLLNPLITSHSHLQQGIFLTMSCLPLGDNSS
jgi:hypothetical protein